LIFSPLSLPFHYADLFFHTFADYYRRRCHCCRDADAMAASRLLPLAAPMPLNCRISWPFFYDASGERVLFAARVDAVLRR